MCGPEATVKRSESRAEGGALALAGRNAQEAVR